MSRGKTRSDSLLQLINDIGGKGRHRDFCENIHSYWELKEEENKNEGILFHHVASIEQALSKAGYLKHQGGKGGLWEITKKGEEHLSSIGHKSSTYQHKKNATISRCETCKFFKEINNGRIGECHRYPPVFTSLDTFPRVSKDSLCGEYNVEITNNSTRVYKLAREFNVESSTIIEKCRKHNFNIKNHMSQVSPGLAGLIREWCSKSE